jgi:hypothetical protein
MWVHLKRRSYVWILGDQQLAFNGKSRVVGYLISALHLKVICQMNSEVHSEIEWISKETVEEFR